MKYCLGVVCLTLGTPGLAFLGWLWNRFTSDKTLTNRCKTKGRAHVCRLKPRAGMQEEGLQHWCETTRVLTYEMTTRTVLSFYEQIAMRWNHRVIKVGKALQDHRVQPFSWCCQGHHWPMSSSATTTLLLNPSRGGNSATAQGSCARAGQPFWQRSFLNANLPWHSLRPQCMILCR